MNDMVHGEWPEELLVDEAPGNADVPPLEVHRATMEAMRRFGNRRGSSSAELAERRRRRRHLRIVEARRASRRLACDPHGRRVGRLLPRHRSPRRTSRRATTARAPAGEGGPSPRSPAPIDALSKNGTSWWVSAPPKADEHSAGNFGSGSTRQALGQALAGLGVRRGTVALVRAGLASPNLQAGLENSIVTKSRRDPSREGSAR